MKLEEAQQFSKNNMAFLKDGMRGFDKQGWAWHKDDELPFRATLSILPTILKSGKSSEESRLTHLRKRAQARYIYSREIANLIKKKSNSLRKFAYWVPCIPISPLEALAKAGDK